MNELVIEINFDESLTMTRADAFQALMVDEFEFGPRDEETLRRHKEGWGIGTSLVTSVLMLEPKGGHSATPNSLLFKLGFNGEISDAQVAHFMVLLNAEMGGSAWGFGTAHVLSVEKSSHP